MRGGYAHSIRCWAVLQDLAGYCILSYMDTQHVPQRDYQVKVACPKCGAVARITATTLSRSGGYPICPDGGTFAEAPRRVYVRRTEAVTA
jgi:hypothetical protein